MEEGPQFAAILMLQNNFVGKTTGKATVTHIAACLINRKIRKPKMVLTENATIFERLIQKSCYFQGVWTTLFLNFSI